jgi:LysM repeat protein
MSIARGVLLETVVVMLVLTMTGIVVLDFYLRRATSVPDALVATPTVVANRTPPPVLPPPPTPALEIITIAIPQTDITPPPVPTKVVRVEEQAKEEFYTVQPGDSLSGIATRYDVPIEVIISANDITDAALIRVGQELVIPLGGGE